MSRTSAPADDHIGRVLARACISRFDVPVVVVDSSDAIRWTSPAAKDRLRPPLPAFLRDGQLHIDEQAGCGSKRLYSAFSAERRQALLGDVASNNWLVLSGWVEKFGSEDLLILAFRLPMPMRTCSDSGLAAQFNLTRAQCAVLDQFARLVPPKEIAEILGLTVHTVRSHLKSIHAKLGVRSNTQLLQLVRAYCDA